MIHKILTKFVDARSEGTDCLFNGYLEDFLQYDEYHTSAPLDLFQKIITINPDAKICVDLKQEIRKEVISNQIIGYKDAFKLEGKTIHFPYLIYFKEDSEERLFLLTKSEHRGHLYAKALYFCLTEPGADFEGYKNQMIAMMANEEVLAVIEKSFESSTGSLQRKIDQEYFKNYQDFYETSLEEANQLKENIMPQLRELSDKEEMIKEVVTKWFLLKKLVYVQYMIDRHLAQQVHNGDIKEQRSQARKNSKEVPFIAYSELWRCSGENLPKEEGFTH